MVKIDFFQECTLREFKERTNRINQEAWKYQSPDVIEEKPEQHRKFFHFQSHHHHRVHPVVR